MHAETPAMNLRGFRDMTAIMAFLANEPVHQGGGHKI